MKLFLTTTIAICLFGLTCSAQWTAGSGIITTPNNVGIGNTSPLAKLHVTGAEVRITGVGTSGIASNGVYTIYDSNNTTRVGFFGDGSPGNSDIYLRADVGALSISTPGTSMYLSTTGNVGIGTTTPQKMLDISNATLPALRLTNSATSVVTGASFGEFDFYANDSSTGGVGITGFVKSVAVNAGVSSALTFGTRTSAGGDAAEVMRIDNAGKVGIGTTHPDQALTVKGTVHSTAVLVETTVPADYVFNADYDLRPLAEVKAYVDKNHHLPEVPSAAEFKKDGQNLGEMNMLLLKKVEELTLYMIEKDKQVEAQKEINKQQNERLKRLEETIKQLTEKK